MKLVPSPRPVVRVAGAAAGSAATEVATEVATGAAIEDAAGSRAADSQTRITAIARASHASRAGNQRQRIPLAPAASAHTIQGEMMATSKSTFQKRQKEMKRQEKARMKAERRAQKKLAGPSEAEPLMEPLTGPYIDPDGALSEPDSEN
jgi:hypothetical protein